MNKFQTKPSPKVHINLPKLHIQPFDGNPLEWLTFWDCYSNAIHNNHELNNMSYLKGLLTCNAARAISGLLMTSQNYDKAIETLKERFGRKQVLINVHMESLSKISAPQLMCSNCEKLKIAGRATFVPSKRYEYKQIHMVVC